MTDHARPVAPPAREPGAVRDHVWLHFTELGPHREVPLIVRGEGTRVYDADGHAYLDALAALYCVNVGHGRQAIADAVAAQMAELAYYTSWGYTHPRANELAERIVGLAPEGMGRVFFTSGGSESVETAWKLVRQYQRLRGRPGKTGIVARQGAYHGTTMGALSITGIPKITEPFGPLIPGVLHAPTVNPYRAAEGPVEHSLQCADAVAELVERAGPDTVGAVIVEPVQNSGGCLTPEPEYFNRLREICDSYDLLLVSDETICSWGRLGTWFGAQRFGFVPDIITTAKGLTSGYVPMGAVIVADHVAEPFLEPGTMFAHGLTFGGHPVAAAAALANIDIIEDEDLCERSARTGERLRGTLESLRDIALVGDVRGTGLFMAIELVADQDTRAPLSAEAREVMTERVPRMLFEHGLICRAMHRGAPLIQFAPPLVLDDDDLAGMERALRAVLTEVAGEVL